MLEVIVGSALVWWVANEAPRASTLIGGSLVIGALLGNELLGWRQRKLQGAEQERPEPIQPPIS